MTAANSFGAFAQLILIILGGFVISRNNTKKFWIWGYWVSPLMYAQNAISVNEFLGHNWKHVLDSTKSNKTVGVQVLESRGLFPESKWFWIGAGALVGYVLFFNLIYIAALTFLDPVCEDQAVISEEALNEEPNRKGAVVKLSSRGQSSQRFQEQGEKIFCTEADPNRVHGMVLEFEPLILVFDNIKYSVDMPVEMKAQGFQEDRLVLLKGLSGSFRPGVLTALMGVSGAGKTTLMDVLSGRKTGGYSEGNIYISGYPKKQQTFARISGYCEQNDIHSPHIVGCGSHPSR